MNPPRQRAPEDPIRNGHEAAFRDKVTASEAVFRQLSPLSLVFALLALATAGVLIISLATMVWGHRNGGGVELNLYDSYITEYMKHGPNWRWLIVASFAFAVVLHLLALGYVLGNPGKLAVIAGGLLLASASMGNFFIAYAPVRAVTIPDGPVVEWWTPQWWFRATTAHTDYERGWRMHTRMFITVPFDSCYVPASRAC